MRKLGVKKGFTLAELLIVVAIIVVLMAVAFVSYISYLRSMTKREYDSYARTIFVAAQNHLTMAGHEGYLGRTDFGTEEPDYGNDTGDGVYYFVIEDGVEKNGKGFNKASSVLGLILPFGSVDETIRTGSYIIRYHKDTAQVLDVFYWSTTGHFDHNNDSSDYKTLLENRLDEHFDDLKKLSRDRSVIGWYGGTTATGLTRGAELNIPLISVLNADKLTVTITDTNDMENTNNSAIKMVLMVKGKLSGKVKSIELKRNDTANASTYDSGTKSFTVVLDDVTTDGKHFAQVCSDFIPGEDITVYAVAYNDSAEVLTNVAYSATQTTNSLFADITDGDDADTVPDTASISSIRHLENLDPAISKLDENDSGNKLDIGKAVQTSDLSWTEFQKSIKGNDTDKEVKIYSKNTGSAALTEDGYYYPVDVATTLDYDGQSHSISDIKVNISGAAGLFGDFAAGRVENLKLIDFTVSGTNAGALIGAINLKEGTVSVTNVLAVNSKEKEKDSIFSASTPNIKGTASEGGTASAGGLIGSMNGGTITNCAAALYVKATTAEGVNATTAAGGLIGTASGGSVTASYAGGHTTGGMYANNNYNVVATGSAGGLIGSSAASITNSYSTCSASGATAGGLIGTADNGTSTNCYCTGLVNGTTAGGAFAGAKEDDAEAINCGYFGIINGQLAALGSGTSAGVTAFDATTETYIAFTKENGRGNANPYDASLIGYYQGKYSLKTVKQLGASVGTTDFVAVHYGDWPTVEIFFVNEKKANS